MESTLNLPNEIWIMILRMVPLEDRLKNVQFVNKHFYALCFDSSITKSLDFGSCVFMPERACLKMVNSAKTWITDLSLKGCHWFTGNFFSKLHRLPELISLNLTGFCITAVQLNKVIPKVPNMKNFAFFMTRKELSSFVDSSQHQEMDLNLNLDTLHFEIVGLDAAESVSTMLQDPPPPMEREHFAKLDADLFQVAQLGRASKSISFSLGLPKALPGIKYIYERGLSEHAIDFACRVAAGCDMKSWEFVFGKLYLLGLYESSANAGGVCRDLTRARYLALPYILGSPCSFDLLQFGYRMKCPIDIPNLECLIAPFPTQYSLIHPFYAVMLRQLILSCDFPKLKCLDIGINYLPSGVEFPIELYSKLSKLQNLEELNLRNLSIDLYSLLESLKCLRKLHSLSITVNGSIWNSPSEAIVPVTCYGSQRISQYPTMKKNEFFADLVESLPNLRRFELTQTPDNILSAKILEPMGKLSKLEELSFIDVSLIDLVYLGNALKSLVHLRSLALLNSGKQGQCEYPQVLFNSLRYLPKLLQISLQHRRLELSPRMFQEICLCKSLEILLLMRGKIIDTTASAMRNNFESILHRCPRLHQFVFVSPGLSDSVSKSIDKYSQNLKRSGRRTALFCGSYHTEMCAVLQSALARVSKSIVAAYNPYDFFESKNKI